MLTPEEKSELQHAAQVVQVLDNDVARAFAHGYDRGFQLRADGLFDARRMEARTLNHHLERLLMDLQTAKVGLEAVRSRLGRRMDDWLNARASLIGARVGLIVFIAVFIGVAVYSGASLSVSALLFGVGQDAGGRFLASLTAVAVALAAIFIARSTARSSLAR